jgi:nicotinate-nucleotide pyrophosphorylase
MSSAYKKWSKERNSKKSEAAKAAKKRKSEASAVEKDVEEYAEVINAVASNDAEQLDNFKDQIVAPEAINSATDGRAAVLNAADSQLAPADELESDMAI